MDTLAARYIALLERCLTRIGFSESTPAESLEVRLEGKDWPADAETMVGFRRLDQLTKCAVDVCEQGIPGDLLEAGVWRGGACILMRGVLAALGDESRKVWVADSFEGLPKPDIEKYPADANDPHWTFTQLAVGIDEVKNNFRRYDLLDDQVVFLQGWFSETLPTAPIDRLAVLRVDGDMYGSTMDVLSALYSKVSPGGYVIIDDYGAIKSCRQAVEDFRELHSIDSPIEWIDWTGVFWRR
jgi:O-methyltransferase